MNAVFDANTFYLFGSISTTIIIWKGNKRTPILIITNQKDSLDVYRPTQFVIYTPKRMSWLDFVTWTSSSSNLFIDPKLFSNHRIWSCLSLCPLKWPCMPTQNKRFLKVLLKILLGRNQLIDHIYYQTKNGKLCTIGFPFFVCADLYQISWNNYERNFDFLQCDKCLVSPCTHLNQINAIDWWCLQTILLSLFVIRIS